MKPPSPRPRKSGVALVVVLAFVVLLVILILAYFSFSTLHRQVSTASSSQALTAIFADGAMNTIIGDLRQEIIAGSTNYSTNSAIPLYFPLGATNAIPERVGTSTNLPNLIKRSAYNLPFYSFTNGAPNRAANSSTTNTSQNGRFLPGSRWNASLLLPKAATNDAADLTPISSFVAPDWIYVTRSGSNPTGWNANMQWNRTNGTTVVGRYAYAIYDEGGLLDLNVAGYPSGSSTNLIAQKGVLAAADLSVIPGLSTNAINALVGWRNYVTAEASGAFPNYSFSGTGVNYFKTMRENTSGFQRTANTSLVNGQSDRMFIGRQQLIQFLTQGVATSDADRAAFQNALQYLGTFSRDLEQPSFRPDPNRPKNTAFSVAVDGGNDAYSADGSLQDKINPALLAIRDAANNPVMKRRFPLSRLALVKPNPSGSDATKIKDYFGLTWDSGKNRWTYDHGGAPGQIYSLGDIPAGREPDFFETLRAVINCDSLGKQHGGLDNNNKTASGASSVYSPHQFSGTPAPAAIDSFVNYQIIQIGANLIDQYDADSFPTAVFYNNREFYGMENLPYLAGWQEMWYRMKALTPGTDIISGSTAPTAADGTTYETWVVIQPIIWNPHAPDANPNPPDSPTNFRVRAGGMTDVALAIRPQVMAAWWTGTDTTHVKSTYPATPAFASATGMGAAVSGLYPYPDAILDPSSSILTFNTGAGDAAFREPFRLRAVNYPPGSNAANDPGYLAGKFTVGADPTLTTADGGDSTVIGFFCGKAWTGPCIDHANTTKWLSVGNLNRDPKLTLEYKAADGQWRTYDVIEQVYATSGNFNTVDNSDTGDFIRGFRTSVRADPRTDRWGLFQMNTFPTVNSALVPSGTNNILNGVDPSTGKKVPLNFLPQGITWKPSATSSYVTTGNNTGGAAANGWSGADWHIGDLMGNFQNVLGNPNAGPKTSANPGLKTFYTDPDGVFRRGSGAYFSGTDGNPMYTGNTNSRPVILNRPFQSVAEMGYAFRGQAWKDVDLFTPESGDAAVLDAFCLNELDRAPDNVTVAGRLNLNTRQIPVLQAVFSGVSKAEGGILTPGETLAAAQALVKWTTADATIATNLTAGVLNKGPLRNRSELVGKFVSQVGVTPKPGLSGGQTPVLEPTKSYGGFSSLLTSGTGGVFVSSSDASIKRRRESIMRALTDSGNTRTWNLLIDLVAQTGRYPGHAGALGNFVVEGETRVWIHVAIDRATGNIVARQMETVSE